MVILKKAVALLDSHKAIDRALDTARSYAEDAISALEAISDDALKSALTDAAYYTVARTL